jgi:hypothetical protein
MTDDARALVITRSIVYGPVVDTAARYQVLQQWLRIALDKQPTPSPVDEYCLDMLLVKVARLVVHHTHPRQERP